MGRATNFVSFKALEKTKQDNHNKTTKTAHNQRQRENLEYSQRGKNTHY